MVSLQRCWRCALVLVLATLAAPSAMAGSKTAWDFSFQRIEGGPLPMRQFDGHPVLLVNTASMCGFTYQYAGLEKLWQARRDQGLIVLGVPSGDFGGQEYDQSGKIKQFCESNFSVDFPLTEKEHVRGSDAHPLYHWLARALGPQAVPKWNFHKILLNAHGEPVAAWSTGTEPADPSITAAIDQALLASHQTEPEK